VGGLIFAVPFLSFFQGVGADEHVIRGKKRLKRQRENELIKQSIKKAGPYREGQVMYEDEKSISTGETQRACHLQRSRKILYLLRFAP
jgi:hypothetical protein